MKGSPAFLFYPDDWAGGTSLMTFAEKGAYIDLLALQFSRGSLRLTDIKRLLKSEFDTIWPEISDKFVEIEDGAFQNERMAAIREERILLSEKRSQVGKMGGRKSNQDKPIGKQMESNRLTNRFGNGDGDGNRDVITMDETKGENKVIPMNDDTRLSLSENSNRNSEAAKIETEFRQLFDVNFEQKGNPASARTAFVQASEQVKQAEKLPLGLCCEKIVEQAARWRVCMMLDGTTKKYWPNCETWLIEGHWRKDFEALAESIRRDNARAATPANSLDSAFDGMGARIV